MQKARLESRKGECEDIVVSSITAYELLVGANYVWRKHGNARERVIVEDMLKPLNVVPLEVGIVRRAAEIKAELMLKGLSVPDLDVLIACSEEGEILTFDADFSPLSDLGFEVTIFGEKD